MPPSALISTPPPLTYAGVKRAGDVVAAFLALLLLFPVFLLLALVVALDSRGPVLYRRRVLARQDYRDGAPLCTFDAFKFRTMIPGADEWLHNHPDVWAEYRKEFKLKNDPRVTRVGGWLRRTSLDELPQIVNVLLGQMSLVGPRMIAPEERERYGVQTQKLLSVAPGLTGLWQVSGRANLPYSERVRLDMEYIERRSLLLDGEILWRTAGSVLSRRGAY